MPEPLADAFGRRFSYLRLSLTDACNFKCVYCLPGGYQRPAGAPRYLNLSEIDHLVTAFVGLGTKKVRLTGGEPTLRPDLLPIIEKVRERGVTQIGLSTNGFRLRALAKDLRAAGLTAINVSVDTLDPEKFRELTGSTLLPQILSGIEAALDAGFPEVKVNAVLLAGWAEHDLDQFLRWTEDRPVAVRLIELMPTGTNGDLFNAKHVEASDLRQQLLLKGWTPRARLANDGPAEELTHPAHRGRMGLIAPYAKDFCAGCNRLRVTSTGGLRLCLFGDGQHALRDLLLLPSQSAELQARIVKALGLKEISHHLPEGKFGNNQTFSAMGG